MLTLRGEGFMEEGRCTFEEPSLGSIIGQFSTLHNSSYLECPMPSLESLSFADLSSGHHVHLLVSSGVLQSRSNYIDFLVYGVSDMTLSALIPSEGIHFVHNTITVYGEGFVNSGEAVCQMSPNNGTVFSSAVTFINSSSLKCTLPPLTSPNLLSISVSLNREPQTIIPVAGEEASQFTFSASPPSILSAVFSTSYTAVQLMFDRPVELGGMAAPSSPVPLTCMAVFTGDSLDTLGIKPDCFWRNSQQRTITISLPPSATVTNGSLLTILNSTVRTRHASYSRHASGTVTVTLPNFPLTPVAVIEGPQNVPLCGNFTLRGLNSKGRGYQPFLYKWEIYSSEAEITEELQEFFSSSFTHTSFLILPSSVFQHHTYSVKLTVQNFLNYESSTTHTFTISTSPFSTPPLTVVGGVSRKACPHQRLVLEATPTSGDDECSYSTPLKYMWRVMNSDGTERVISSTRTDLSFLVLPPHFFEHNQTYFVEVYDITERDNSAIVTVNTAEPCLVAHIQGGDYREIGLSKPVQLDGSQSEGLTPDVISDSLFFMSWFCSSEGQPCLGLDEEVLVFESNISLSLFLPLGTYVFTLVLHYDTFTSSDNTTVRVIEDSSLQIQLDTPTCCGPVPAHDSVSIVATVHSHIVVSSVQWSVDNVPGQYNYTYICSLENSSG